MLEAAVFQPAPNISVFLLLEVSPILQFSACLSLDRFETVEHSKDISQD